MSAHGASVLVRSDPRRLLFLAVPTLLVALTEGLTSQGRVMSRPVWLAFGAAALVFFFALYWFVAVSVADGCVAVRRGLTTRRLPLVDLDRVVVEGLERQGYVIRCHRAGVPELKVPLIAMRPGDRRLVIEAIRAGVPGVLRKSAALWSIARAA
ncbi:hypothetical protein OG594_09560 [Streptomyces sp. NBC_01214]|uniref:hypothetical protein n=1 Tax=Streptomyces sp. NBC_01214 TaxID=2903777 RepID=UPI0022538482|nr:hypothetical protein [Streptomyces sp. NBC_01214]MCX4801890.1 hypothetical protein [Streptomyces sp. NBC_01214]